ncbi:MAG: hypothetical protein J5I90_05495 [Caldilineales bacterium]|nr:hypothetical protein [Caldilineales bacterium]
MKTYTIDFENKKYTWTGKRWYETDTFATPPAGIIHKLNWALEEHVKHEDDSVSNVGELLRLASFARENGQAKRAEQLGRRALSIDPDSLAAVAVICAALRAQKRPAEALGFSYPYRERGSLPLLTSRAAAFCDLKQWRDAKREISYAFSIGESEEAYNVLHRIKSERPDLFPD